MKNSAMNPCRYLISAAFYLLFLVSTAIAQPNCISVVSTACVDECHSVRYVGNASPNATYNWTISCGTITNPNLQNPHTACFLSPGLCIIQVIVQEPGQAPDTCVAEVEVFPIPEGNLTLSRDSVCLGDCIHLNIQFKGTPPFNFQIQANGATSNYSSNSTDFTLQVCPRSNTTFSLISLSDFFCTNTNPNSQATVVVLPPFNGFVAQRNNVLCASPPNISYAWYACGGTTVLSTQMCFAPSQNGCYCVVLDNGLCTDTVCTNFVCDLTCSFAFPDTICVGDTALIYYTGNGGPNAILNWTLNIDNLIGQRFFGVDSLRIKYSLPGCYPINLSVREANCGSTCTDTICVISKPCKCDVYTQNKITPISSSGSSCCYDVSGDIASIDCFKSIQIFLSNGSFNNVQSDAAAGWSHQLNGTQEIQYFHNSGGIPPGNFHPGSFCVEGASNYSVTVRYLKNLGGFADTCTFRYVFNCPKPPQSPKCDSLFSYLEKQHTLPAVCCYNIHTDNPTPNCFDRIKVTCISGSLNNIQANINQGFILIPGSPQEFSITHSSGFIPAGQSLPASFCISSGINPISILVKYYFTGAQGKDSCSFRFEFDCPGFNPPPDCCDSTSLSLSPFGMQPNCCYTVNGYSNKSKCFSQICFTTSSGNFTNIVANPGWTASVTPGGFCFVPTAQFIPTGNINPGSFCMTGATNPFTITANYFDPNGMILNACKKTFVRDCPPPPPVCDCNGLSNQLTSVSNNPGVCCYAIQGNVTSANCYTQIAMQLSSGSFTNINPGPQWSSFSQNAQNFTLNHNSGFIPMGSINPANFCVTGSTNYVVTVHYIFSNNGIKDSCTFRYTLNCTAPPKPCSCDSLTTTVNQTSVVPGLCCYNIQAKVPSGNCYTSMQVVLSSGSFVNVQNATGFSLTNSSAQSFTLSHNSGFIPSGTINPASFCVSGSTFYMVTVHYFYSNNGIKDTCSFNYTFDCPSTPKPCNCDSLSTVVKLLTAVPGLCCYAIEGLVPLSNCFSSMQVTLSAGSFINVLATPGWSVSASTAQSFMLNYTTGFFPSGSINPATFCVIGSNVYTVSVHYFYSNNGIKDTCSFNYTLDCPSLPKICSCDSLKNTIQQTSVHPGLCCYEMEGNIPSSNCYSSIQLDLSNGSFTNVLVDTAWTLLSSSAQSISLVHNSGFIPQGIIHPVKFCVSGSSFYNIDVYYFYNNNGIKDTCSFNYTFDCPSVQDSLCRHSNCISANKSWQTIASGVTFVYDMVVYQCQLIVAGQFNQIGSVPLNNIAAWDGNTWTPLAQGVNGTVRALAVHNGLLYVGGQFTTAGTTANVNNIAVWNGSNWSHLDNGLTGAGLNFVGALLSTGNGLVVGGQFQNAGLSSALPTNNIAQWNGTSWNHNFNSLTNVFNGPIYTLREYSGQLYAAGTFSSPHLNTCKWNGSSWSNNGSGITLVNNVPYDGVSAQYEYNGNLMVGGHFLNANNLAATQHIASWDGSNWSAMAGGDLSDTIDAVHDFIRYDNKLYAGGAINQMGTTVLNGVGEWDGSNWFSTNHPNHLIWALEAYDSCGTQTCDLYSAGEGFINRWVCITGNKNTNQTSGIYIQPNPVEDILNVIIENQSISKTALLRIYDLQGKLVINKNNILESVNSIDVSKLIPGMYIVEYVEMQKVPRKIRFIKK